MAAGAVEDAGDLLQRQAGDGVVAAAGALKSIVVFGTSAQTGSQAFSAPTLMAGVASSAAFASPVRGVDAPSCA